MNAVRRSIIKTAVASFFLMHCFACGHWPPVVGSAKDIGRLHISELSIRARGITDADIPALARLHELRHLDFGGGWGVVDSAITDAGLKQLSELDLHELDFLDLGSCPAITDAGVANVSTMHSLTWINLFFCDGITDASLQSLSKMPRLRQLGLMGCDGMTDEGLRHLAKQESLEVLDLRGCPGITDRGLEYLAEKKNWDILRFGGCANVSEEAVARLLEAVPTAIVRKDEKEWLHHLEEAAHR